MRKIVSTFFRFLGISLAALFAILATAAIVLALILMDARQVLLNAGTYKRALIKDRIYERLPSLVAEQAGSLKGFIEDPCARLPLACAIERGSPELQACLQAALGDVAYVEVGSRRKATDAEMLAAANCLEAYPIAPSGEEPSGPESEGGAGSMAFFKSLDAEDWQALLSVLLPPDDLQRMTEAALDGVFAYLAGEADEAAIPLEGLKARLSGQAGRDLLGRLLDAQPPCTEDQLARFAAEGLSHEDGERDWCSPPSDVRPEMLADLEDQLRGAVAGIPDRATLIRSTAPTYGPGVPGFFDQEPRKFIGPALGWSPLLPLLLLGLVALFAVRSLRGWLRWWGIPLLIAGLAAVGLAFALPSLVDHAWNTYAIPQIPAAFTASLGETAGSLANSVGNDAARWLGIAAGLTALAGAAAIAGSFFVGAREQPGAILSSSTQ